VSQELDVWLLDSGLRASIELIRMVRVFGGTRFDIGFDPVYRRTQSKS
jgi:hypothetical protein